MAEEDKRTEEEKLIADATAGTQVAVDGTNEDQEVSPEQKLISELQEKAKIAEERAANAERERDTERTQKDSARKEAATANNDKIVAYENTVKTNLAAAKTGFDSAKKDYLEAYNAGDPAAILEAQTKLNDAQNMLRSAEYGESQMKTWKESQKNQAPTERFIPAEKDWIKNNQWFERGSSKEDRIKTAAVYAAVEEANQKGIARGSSAYFDLINEYIGDTDSEPKKAELKIVETPKKKEAASSIAAPSSGTAGVSAKSASSKVFHMTPEHRAAVQINYPEEYKKDPKAAEEKYAKRQLEIQERRKNGERI